MSEDELQITFSNVSRPKPPDQTQRVEQLTKEKRLIQLGEKDNRFRSILFTGEALNDMAQYGMTDRTKELAGVLCGFHNKDQTIITRFVALPNATSASGTVSFTKDTWAEALMANDKLNTQLGTKDDIMAWFHTHPRNYPPIPDSMEDQFIMKHYFPESDKSQIDDRTTIIMTTMANNPEPQFAAWKWDKNLNEAVYVKGVLIAQNPRTQLNSSYYPVGISEQRKGTQHDSVVINLPNENRTIIEDDIAIIENDNSHTLNITITDENNPPINIILHDQNPDPNILRISVDELSPEKQKAIAQRLKTHPGGHGSKLLQTILDALQTTEKPILPEPIIRKKQNRLEDEIRIISDHSE